MVEGPTTTKSYGGSELQRRGKRLLLAVALGKLGRAASARKRGWPRSAVRSVCKLFRVMDTISFEVHIAYVLLNDDVLLLSTLNN